MENQAKQDPNYFVENITCTKDFQGKTLEKQFSQAHLDRIGKGADGTYDGWNPQVEVPQGLKQLLVSEQVEEVDKSSITVQTAEGLKAEGVDVEAVGQNATAPIGISLEALNGTAEAAEEAAEKKAKK